MSLHPAWANLQAQASPIPELAPVHKAYCRRVKIGGSAAGWSKDGTKKETTIGEISYL